MIPIVRVFLDRLLYTDGCFIYRVDAHCAGLDTAKKREAEWKEKEQMWASAPTNSTSDGWGPPEDDSQWVGSEEQLFNTLYTMYRGVWLSVAGGVEVTVDVHLVLEGSLDKERSACRSL
jgi:hypothetical protein